MMPCRVEFTNGAIKSARAFRAALDVLARPGRIATLTGAAPPPPLSVAAGTLLLTLADATTPVHLAPSHDLAPLREWLTFHCGAPLVGPADAVFALGRWDALQPVTRFATGTTEYPDRSVTLIVEMSALAPDIARLTGPGIKGRGFLGPARNRRLCREPRPVPVGVRPVF